MALLTIGEFAHESGLTPKALRLYGEQGLLVPAAVDSGTGYRYYDRGQLGRAHLISGLRRLGMPLARIAAVCDLPAPGAADAVTAFWNEVAADTADRAHLASTLVQHLTGRSTGMTLTIHLDHAAATDTGAVRTTNEDAAHAGDRLLAVADATGGPGGAAAAAAAVDAVRALETADIPTADLLTRLAAAVTSADTTIRHLSDDDTRPVTTLTALLRRDTRLALVHIGDTRAYLLRDGELSPLTHDHTWVQTQVDEGRLTTAEAAAHPHRAILVRALGTGPDVEADFALRTARPGDRYLLCSDGLHSVVGHTDLRTALAAGTDPRTTVDRLITLAHAAGAPDNIACVVADAT